MTALIDVHCHLFDRHVLTFAGRILAGLAEVVTDLLNSGDYAHAETKIERLNAFIEMSQKDGATIAQTLYGAYGDGAILVPLMYDMYYLTHDLEKDFRQGLEGLLATFDRQLHADGEQAAAIRAQLEGIGGDVLKDIVDGAIDHDSFDIQLQELLAVKAQFGARIYPFLSFDPRRPGNLEQVQQLVGPGKPFHGVKLYAPLGFSAAHPRLMDPQQGLYAYCVANDIPITAHCSCPGMPTMNDHLAVPADSWVFASSGGADDGDGACSKYNQGGVTCLPESGIVDFSDGGAYQKSLYFNHPDIWEVVLQAFPTLRLNLAHFGGDCKDWRQRIARLIDSGSYPNLYTDISCRTVAKELAGIRREYEDSAAVRQRLLFGSDFSILLLSSDLPDFLAGVEQVFPRGECQDVYGENAKRFLRLD